MLRSWIESARTGRHGLIAAALLMVVALHGRALAESAHAGDSPEYRKLIEDGLQEFDHSNWEEATALFEQAHAINPNARTLRALGLCAFEARRYTEALGYLNAAITDKRKPLTAPQRAELQRSIERAEHYVGRLKLVLEPPDASVRIDGQAVQVEPEKELLVNSGVLEVEVTAPDHQTEVRRVRVGSQAHEELVIKLAPTAEAAAPEPTAPAPASTATPAAPPVDTQAGSSALHTWKWVTGGIALAALATGATTLVLSDSEAKKWNACLDDTDHSCLQHQDRSKTYKTIGIIGVSAGAAFGIVTAVFFVLDARSSSTTSAARACLPGPGELGVQCRVAF